MVEACAPTTIASEVRVAKPQYRGDWPSISAAVRQAQPWCAWCETTVDLCADHLVPGRPELGVRTLCRGCNTRRRNGATGPVR